MQGGFDSFGYTLTMASAMSQVAIAIALWRIVRFLDNRRK